MPGRFDPEPTEDEADLGFTFDDVTMLVLVCVVTAFVAAVFGLGLWAAGKHLFCFCRHR